jgi:outer membrane protein
LGGPFRAAAIAGLKGPRYDDIHIGGRRMLRIGIGFVLAWCVAAPHLQAQAPPPLLTLTQAVKEALLKNDRMLNQQDSIEQAELGVRLARNTFQPKVVPNVLGSFGQTDVNSQTYRVDVSQKLTTGTEVRLGIGTSTAQIPGAPGVAGSDIHFYNADTTLTLSQPLLRGFGPTIARRSLTSAELRRADADRQKTLAEQQIAVEVASAYYQVVAQQAFVGVARSTVDRARKLRDASEAKLDAGLVSQLDVLRAQQLVSQAEIQFFDAQAAVDDARDRLLFLIGHDAGESFDVEGDIPKSAETFALGDAVATAVERRLDLRSLASSGEDAERQVSFARNQLLPQFDVNFALTRRETANSFPRSFGLDRFQFATFFTIAMPVDRTAQLVDYQNAIIERDRRKREASTLQRQIADSVKRAIRERDRLLRSLIAAETAVDIGRKEVEVAQLRYDRGLSNNLDVVTAESTLLAAESRRISALADSAVARLSLRAMLGILDPRTDIAP